MGIIQIAVIAVMVITAIFFFISMMLLAAFQYRETQVEYWTTIKSILKSKAFYKWLASLPFCKHKEVNHFNGCKNCKAYIRPKKK